MTGRRARRPEDYWSQLAREGVAVEPLGDDAGPVTSSPAGGVVVLELPTRSDPVARAASPVIGGPAGRRLAVGTGAWRVVPVLVLLATVVLGLGVVQKEHCRGEGWSTPDQFWHACYSDIPVLYGSAHLGDAARPGLSTAVQTLDTPPVVGAAMWVVSAFVPQNDAQSARRFFDLSAVLLLGALVVAVAVLALDARRRGRPWDAAHLALSPLLLTAALVSYQLLAVLLLALAVHAWTREHGVRAGVLLGAAVAAAPVLWLLVPVVALLALRSGRSQAAANVAGGALVTWFLLRVALLPGLFGGLGAGWRDWHSSAPGYGSLWLAPQLLADSEPDSVTSPAGRVVLGLFRWVFDGGGITPVTFSVLTVVLGVLLLAAVVWFSFGGGTDQGWPPALLPGAVELREEVRLLAPLALAVLSVGLIMLRAVPVQASLLLLPLIALAGLPWRDHLIWAATELAYFVGVWMYIASDTTPDRGLPAFAYLLLLLARLAGIGYLGVRGVLAARAISLSRVPAASL